MATIGSLERSSLQRTAPVVILRIGINLAGKKMKKCKKCGLKKPSSDFYSHSTNKDRLFGSCKQCCVEISKERVNKIREKRKKILITEGASYKKPENNRKKYYREWAEKNRKHVSEYKKKYSENRKIEEDARNKFRSAVFHGKIKRPIKCSKCDSEKGVIHGHHADYLKPYDVIWLCKSCHQKEHRKKNG